MGKLYIAEYGANKDEPPGILHVLPVGPTSQASDAFASSTRFLRLHSDSICYVAFGKEPTATVDHSRLAANTTEWFNVHSGQKVAVIGDPEEF